VPANLLIRDYVPAADEEQLLACVVELQDFERRLEPALLPGDEMAGRYLRRLLERCATSRGTVLIAEVDGEVAGFVAVLSTVLPEELDEDPTPYAYVTDLVVLPWHRRMGIGRALLEGAEAFARANGASSIRIGVLARNGTARDLYIGHGFADYHVQLLKKL
jgi:ribosomal protein S18 acetylase RimI-like enzyme